MSQPGLPPQPQPPLGYGGYGGDLQHYPSQGYPPSYSPPTYPVPPAPALAPWPQPAAPHPQVTQPPQRPVAVGLAATLAVTASLQLVGLVSMLWLIAVAGSNQLGTTGPDGVLYHILHRFDDRMVTGLAWPLYLFPLAAIVLGLLLPARRPWARLAFTLLGVAAVAWLAWWFRSDLRWLVVPGSYIAFCTGILWTAAASRWYRWQPGSDGHPQPS